MECVASPSRVSRDHDGPLSSRDMSGHKRKQRDAMEVDQKGHSHSLNRPVNNRHAGTHAPGDSHAIQDKHKAALNYGRGYFKGTHMPVDGWFQPCNVCRNWTGYTIAHNEADVPICRRCKPAFASRVQQQKQKQLAEQQAAQQAAQQQAAQQAAFQAMQQALMAAGAGAGVALAPAPAPACLMMVEQQQQQQESCSRQTLASGHTHRQHQQQSPAGAGSYSTASTSAMSAELCKALSARLGVDTPVGAARKLAAAGHKVQQSLAHHGKVYGSPAVQARRHTQHASSSGARAQVPLDGSITP